MKCDNMYPIYPMPYMPNMGMDINNQIKALEKRISNLESIINNSYNNSGYQMM